MSRAKMSTTVFPGGQEPKGKTEWERFNDVMGRVLSVSKEESDKHARRASPQSKKPKRS